jgi:hypothetical protein
VTQLGRLALFVCVAATCAVRANAKVIEVSHEAFPLQGVFNAKFKFTNDVCGGDACSVTSAWVSVFGRRTILPPVEWHLAGTALKGGYSVPAGGSQTFSFTLEPLASPYLAYRFSYSVNYLCADGTERTQSTPEPGSFFLVGLGALGLAGRLWRTRNSRPSQEPAGIS